MAKLREVFADIIRKTELSEFKNNIEQVTQKAGKTDELALKILKKHHEQKNLYQLM